MRKYMLVALMILATAGFAAAQLGSATVDELGAHLNYGRGCAGCHAPHSGAYGNGAAKTADATSGDTILWGQDVGSLYGKTILTGGGGYYELLPSAMTATTPDVSGLITCLSCHDGNWAQGAMMKNKVYESLPPTYGGYNNVPTLLGNDDTTLGNYLNDHPVGLNAAVGCTGAPWNWDCTEVNGKITMNGPLSGQFFKNYGFFVSPAAYNNKATVQCTTCHNQHVMNEVSVTSSNSGGNVPYGYYQTMFFLKGPYNPASTTAGWNQTSQFCRECHGGNSNEMNGSTAGTVF